MQSHMLSFTQVLKVQGLELLKKVPHVGVILLTSTRMRGSV